MRRVIDTLNEISFTLPEGWHLTKDRYNIMNGQGFINKENYLSDDGRVISLFEVHRDPDEFFAGYQNLIKKYNTLTDKFQYQDQFVIKLNGFNFPMYVIKGFSEKVIYNIQVFVNCGDCLACFMITLNKFDEDLKKLSEESTLFNDLIEILRTVE